MAIVFVADEIVDGVTGRVIGHVEFLVERGLIVDMGTAVVRPSGVDVVVLYASDDAEKPLREATPSRDTNIARLL